MAELVVPECPRCGADIELRPDGTAGVCKYCDAQVLVLESPHHPAQYDIERRKEALELLGRDLSGLQAQANQALYRMRAAEAGPAMNARVTVVPILLFVMMAAMGGFMSFLFYILDLPWVFGIQRGMCLLTGAVVVIVGVGGALGLKAASGRMAQNRREQAMRSPEYFAAVQELQALQIRIQKAQQDVERADRELRAILLGPQQPI